MIKQTTLKKIAKNVKAVKCYNKMLQFYLDLYPTNLEQAFAELNLYIDRTDGKNLATKIINADKKLSDEVLGV